MMNFVFNMMNYALQMMNFVFKMIKLPLAEHGGWRLARLGLLEVDRRLPKFQRDEEEELVVEEAATARL